MKKINQIIATIALVLGVGVLFVPVTASAAGVDPYGPCAADPTSSVCKAKDTSTIQPLIKTIVDTLLFFVGIVSVIMIIIGGIMYTVSTGDQSNVTKAKNTITYALVGLVVSFLAYAIVHWVLHIFG